MAAPESPPTYGSSERRPRLVVLSAEVLDESAPARVPGAAARVRGICESAVRAGWDVALFARSAGSGRRHTVLGTVPVVLLPVGGRALRRPPRRPAARLRRKALRHVAAAVRRGARQARRAHDVARLRPQGLLAAGARGALERLDGAVRTERLRAARWSAPSELLVHRPRLLALDLAFGPLLERLRPDAVHACGLPTAVAAAHAAARMRAAGHRCRWVYEPRRPAGADSAAECVLLHSADAVVTETEARAGALRAEHRLAIAPPALPATELPYKYTELTGLLPPTADFDAVGRSCRSRAPAPQPDAPRPRWTPLGETPVRLGLGPADHSGQLAELARAVCTARDDVSAEVFAAEAAEKPVHPVDVLLDPRSAYRPHVQLEQLQRVLAGYTHLLADAFRPVFGRLNGPHLEDDLPDLLRSPLRTALLARGSEVRHPARHLERHGADSLFCDAPEETRRRLARLAERNRRVAEESGLPVFAATPDLLADLPAGAVWMPLVVDVAALAGGYPVMKRSRPVVLHAPSRRWTKGTERILPALEELDRRGHVRFELVEGVAHAEVRERVRRADIVVDQFGAGAYGNLACEAMAAGKPVLARLDAAVEAALGVPAPLVNTRAGDVGCALEALLDDREEAIRIGAAARKFAEDHHDGRRTVQALSAFLGHG
ncbi:glycosyltransferase family 1 protein [Streptomyces xiaopingdaonensis]|uniref:glycosyltransferase family 1 protein n=1 Tax=Streptomyces xiaopingdaonensis TaxID=1565415 RepID=UPI001ED8F1F0|nr:glycosyltransferase family 1 protein [Streptomyces xiaopingdaonensis]